MLSVTFLLKGDSLRKYQSKHNTKEYNFMSLFTFFQFISENIGQSDGDCLSQSYFPSSQFSPDLRHSFSGLEPYTVRNYMKSFGVFCRTLQFQKSVLREGIPIFCKGTITPSPQLKFYTTIQKVNIEVSYNYGKFFVYIGTYTTSFCLTQ